MAELKILIDGAEVEVTNQTESPVLISYTLEDDTDSQSKGSGQAFDVDFPATLANDQAFNTFRRPDVDDNSPNHRFRAARSASITADNVPLLVGKALLKMAVKSKYTVNFYGDNGDWLVDMQDLTLFDCLPANSHTFALYGAGGPGVVAAPYGIEDSWSFNGTNEQQTWVYAPVRYGEAFGDSDTDVQIIQMRPSLFIYWIIYRAFKKYGWQISSQFMDSPVFRRITMPWTWGNFLGINSKLADLLKFRATGSYKQSTPDKFSTSQSGTGSGSGGGQIFPGTLGGGAFTIDDGFTLNNTSSFTGYDNNGNYTFDNTTGEWKWTYKLANGYNFGTITGFFGVSASGDVGASSNSNASIYCDVYLNGALQSSNQMFNANATGITSVISDHDDHRVLNFSVPNLVLGDVVAIKFRYTYSKSFLGQTSNRISAYDDTTGTVQQTTFELFRIAIQPGSVVNWSYFQQFKNYKFLDFLRGVLDTADIIPKSDSLTKTVVMEPSHACKVGASSFNGYFKMVRLDWSSKRDLSQESPVVSFDDLNRDYLFQFKDDSNDAGLQIFNKRYDIAASTGKFRFNERFKDGTQTFENRFFSPVMHLKMTQWQQFDPTHNVIPQIVTIVPEKISDTSSGQDETAFAPKLCYYKGYILAAGAGGVGTWRMNGFTYGGYPYMFAVNYQPGGENDMILSYSDHKINGVVASGLLRRFFLQRMAIQDTGVQYKPWMRLNNNDVTNWMHRERVVIDGNLYLLNAIDKWDPLHPVSAQCTFWKFVPVEQKHSDQIFPSSGSVLGTLAPVPTTDIAYQQLFILSSDLPTL